jgi:hypothetical protein
VGADKHITIRPKSEQTITKSPSRDKRHSVCHWEPQNELPDYTTSQKRKLHHPVKNSEHNVRERTFGLMESNLRTSLLLGRAQQEDCSEMQQSRSATYLTRHLAPTPLSVSSSVEYMCLAIQDTKFTASEAAKAKK